MTKYTQSNALADLQSLTEVAIKDGLIKDSLERYGESAKDNCNMHELGPLSDAEYLVLPVIAKIWKFKQLVRNMDLAPEEISEYCKDADAIGFKLLDSYEIEANLYFMHLVVVLGHDLNSFEYLNLETIKLIKLILTCNFRELSPLVVGLNKQLSKRNKKEPKIF